MKPALEADIQREILLAAPALGYRLLRNNVGAFKDATGRWVHFGVGGNGGSDLIGWGPQGRFVAVECKRKGKKPTAEQLAFLDAVKDAGGISAVCYSVEDFREMVCGADLGASE